MKSVVLNILLLAMPSLVSAQSNDASTHYTYDNRGVFSHFDAAFTIGTTGLGFDLATPITPWLRLRAGGTFHLQTHRTVTLTSEVGEGQTEALQQEHFEQLSDFMSSLTTIAPQRDIAIEGTMTMNNAKVLIDFFPFKNNRHWHLTAGVYYGGKQLMACHNTTESLVSLSSVDIYNMIYALAKEGEFLDLSSLGMDIPDDMKSSIIAHMQQWGTYTDDNGVTQMAEYGISYPIGTYKHDIIAEQDVYDASGNKVCSSGEVVRKAGETVRLVPDAQGLIHPEVEVNRLKPYVGVGYDCALSRDKRTRLNVEAGVLFWGGSPKVNVSVPVGMTQDGENLFQTIDLVSDASNVTGSLGKQIDKAKDYTVFPSISLRLSQRLW